jgi:Tol biopolymer transport system component
LKHTQFLLSTGSSWRKDTHIHPFLSPDGSMGFFNSDESGTLQAFLVRGW